MQEEFRKRVKAHENIIVKLMLAKKRVILTKYLKPAKLRTPKKTISI
jgi:hypothetical protein